MRSLLLASILLKAVSAGCTSNGWHTQHFKTIVTFGDSYTDENRLGYFGSHNGSAPPVGWDGGVVSLIHFNVPLASAESVTSCHWSGNL